MTQEQLRGTSPPLVRFPPGEPVFTERACNENLFTEVDVLLDQGYCATGWIEFESPDNRLTCLIHQGKPYLAGLVERKQFSWVPLREFTIRAKQMDEAICGLFTSDLLMVLMMAVHFRNTPDLQATTNLVDLGHVLAVLAHEGQDAALALERAGLRTLMFLQKGVPARVYFGDYKADPGQGSVSDRFLQYGFATEAPLSKVEVFHSLKINPDPDTGKAFAQIEKESLPPPPVTIQIKHKDRMVLQRLFMPPAMMIGRDSSCELQLDNLGVSRRHAQLSWDRGRFWIEDMGSANGTLIAGHKVAREELTPRVEVTVGKFSVKLTAPMATPTPQATLMLSPKDGPDQLFLVGDDTSVPIESEITMGKAEGVDVRVKGWSIKPIHARLKNEGDGTARLTCVGKAKVVHKGQKVQSLKLSPDDAILVGGIEFKLMSVPSYKQIGR